MVEEKYQLINSSGQKIVGLLNRSDGDKPATKPFVLLHGFKGYMRQPLISGLAERLAGLGYSVFCFDATNGLGESGGRIYDGTVSHFLEDVLVVLNYAVDRSGGGDNLALFGTSMGGLVATLTAEKDSRVKFLVTHSPSYDWKILRNLPDIVDWQEGQWIEFISKSKGIKFKVDFNLYTDGLRYNPYPELKKLTIPKLFLHSGADEAVSLELSNRAFHESVPPKKFVVLPGAPHNPTAPATLDLMASEIDRFLSTFGTGHTTYRFDNRLNL